jgi:tetratricopeptide (TPR) repeat protein
MIDYNLQFTGIGLPFFSLLAFLAPLQSSTGLQIASFGRWKRRKRLNDAAAVLAALVVFVTVWEGLFLVSSSLGRRAASAGDTERTLYWYKMSHAELFSRDLLLSEAQIKSAAGDYEGALASLDTYQPLNPHDSRAWKIRGSILLSLNRFPEALSALEQAYEGGRYTDAGILRLLLQTSAQNPTAAYRARKTEFDELFVAYADAISANTHFIALSDNVEELQQIARILGRLFPSDTERYLDIARDAQHNAQKERAAFDARPPGTLW